jgi:hypothetical protein
MVFRHREQLSGGRAILFPSAENKPVHLPQLGFPIWNSSAVIIESEPKCSSWVLEGARVVKSSRVTPPAIRANKLSATSIIPFVEHTKCHHLSGKFSPGVSTNEPLFALTDSL